MIVGSLLVSTCLLVLGWTAEIVGLFVQDAEKVYDAWLCLHLGLLTDCSGQKCYNCSCCSKYLCG